MLLLAALAVVLRAWAYFSNTSLWLDEILLARNILELPLPALLTEPLYLDQVAPLGFLLIEPHSDVVEFDHVNPEIHPVDYAGSGAAMERWTNTVVSKAQ